MIDDDADGGKSINDEYNAVELATLKHDDLRTENNNNFVMLCCWFSPIRCHQYALVGSPSLFSRTSSYGQVK